MRLSAYKKSLDDCVFIPSKIDELNRYFKDLYDPRQAAINYILEKARKDTANLTHSQFIELCEHSKTIVARCQF